MQLSLQNFMGVCLLNDSICNPDSRTLVGFDEAWVEKMGKLITSYIEFLFIFCQSVENSKRKLSIQKVWVTAHLSE